MILCRSKKVALLCCTLLLFSAPVTFAKFHFRGGDIEDIANEIKQALETAKQSEIYLQYKQIKSDYDEMREIWGNFSSALDDLHSTVETTMTENPISRLLSTGSEITGEDVYTVFDERTKFDFLYNNYGNTKEGRKYNMDRFNAIHEEEFKNTLKVAQNSEKLSEEINNAVADTVEDQSGNGYAFKQKQVAINAYKVMANIQNVQTKAQKLITDIEGSIRQQNVEDNEELAAKEQEIYIPDSQNEFYKRRADQARMKELPR